MFKLIPVNIHLITILLSIVVFSSTALAGNSVKGKQLYQRNCAQCHGINGKPTMPRAADFSKKEGLRVSDKSLMARIKRGSRSCPAVGGMLKDQEIIDLISHLRTFR